VLAAVPHLGRAGYDGGGGASAAATSPAAAPGSGAGVRGTEPAGSYPADGGSAGDPPPTREALTADLFYSLAGPDEAITADGLESLSRLSGYDGEWPRTFQALAAKFAGGAVLFDLAAFRLFTDDPGHGRWTTEELGRCLRLLQARPLGGLIPSAARQAALHSLFQALDLDGDGRLKH
jgi:hypothetical protein